jgi:hypothetical protein
MPFDPFESGPKAGKVGRAYVSPNQVGMGLAGDIPLSSYIPAGTFGGKSSGKGTVIPHHKPGRGGGSLGYNPHKPPHKHVMIDSHVPGRAVALDLAKITPEASKSAYATGMEFAGEVMEDPPDQIDGIETRIEEGPRLGVYAAVRLLAENGAVPDGLFGQPVAKPATQHGTLLGGSISPPQVHASHPATTGKAKADAFGVGNVGQVNPQVNVVRGHPQGGIQVQATTVGAQGHGPLARFRTAPAPQASPVQVANSGIAASAPEASRPVGPPVVKVIFDFGNQVGQFPAQYHDVIKTKGGLILAWDTRWPHGEPYSPEHLPENTQFALQVPGHTDLYLAMSTGATFTFEHHGYKFFHLGIIDQTAAN